MKKYLLAMMIVNASLFACSDLDEDESLATRNDYEFHDYDLEDHSDDICYENGVINNFDNYYGDIITEDESDSGDHPDNQSNELLAWY